jgi:hypothetical protein
MGMLLDVSAAGAQTGPDTRRTMALEGTMKTFYKAAHTFVIVTADGAEHVYQFTKDLLIHGGKGTGVDALADLREGTTVVVHYESRVGGQAAVELDQVGGEGLKTTEGIVTHVDRKRGEITIRFDNGSTEKLQLTARAAAEAPTEIGQAGATRVIVYYSDEGGHKVAHFFKKV